VVSILSSPLLGTLAPSATLSAPGVGAILARAGDADGDGYDDVWAGTVDSAYLVSGPITGDGDLSSAVASVATVAGLVSLDGGQELDGDAVPDLAWVDGDTLCLASGPFWGAVEADASYAAHATSTAFAGDTDADGRAEVLVSRAADPERGAAGVSSLLFQEP